MHRSARCAGAVQAQTGWQVRVAAGPFIPLLYLICALLPALAWSADHVRVVVAGSEHSMGAQIVRDIGKTIAQPANIAFDLHYSSGSTDSLLRLKDGSGLQFALLQADLADAFLGAAARGSAEAGKLIAPARVIAPLYDEEIIFVVRSDSPLNFVHDIVNARINLGPSLGGSALTVSNLYRLMFGKALPEQQSSFHPHQEALADLTEKTVDVVAFVASRPAQLLAEMKPAARRFVKLLKFDPRHASAAAVTRVYSATRIPAATYPNLLTADLPALAVNIYLVRYGSNDALEARFGSAWCHYLPKLRAKGHSAIRDLKPVPPALAPGWQYAPAFAQKLVGCNG